MSRGTDDWTWDEEPWAMSRYDMFTKEGHTVTTNHGPIDANTERVSYTLEDGTGHRYLQRWDCGLDNAPPMGARFKVLHDEWIRQPDDSMLRIIHSFELVPDAHI